MTLLEEALDAEKNKRWSLAAYVWVSVIQETDDAGMQSEYRDHLKACRKAKGRMLTGACIASSQPSEVLSDGCRASNDGLTFRRGSVD